MNTLQHIGGADDKGKRLVVCLNCEFKTTTHRPLHQIYHSCVDSSKRVGVCRFFGPQKRLQECPSCAGKVQIKIFNCSVHSECTPITDIANVVCCTNCKDYEALDGQDDGGGQDHRPSPSVSNPSTP